MSPSYVICFNRAVSTGILRNRFRASPERRWSFLIEGLPTRSLGYASGRAISWDEHHLASGAGRQEAVGDGHGVHPWCNRRASGGLPRGSAAGWSVGEGAPTGRRSCRDVGARRRDRASPSALRRAASSRRSGSHRPAGALALVIVMARYGTASHPSADQERDHTESVAAAERCPRARHQKIDSRDRPDRRSKLSARRTSPRRS